MDKAEVESVTMMQEPCDRCGKVADLRPYKWSPVAYRGRTLDKPWLCRKCFLVEKRKAWAAKEFPDVHG